MAQSRLYTLEAVLHVLVHGFDWRGTQRAKSNMENSHSKKQKIQLILGFRHFCISICGCWDDPVQTCMLCDCWLWTLLTLVLFCVSLQKPSGPGAPGSPRSLPLSSPSPEPQPGPSLLASAPAGVQVEVQDERYLTSPYPEIVRSQQSSPLSIGSSSDGSTSGKRAKPYGSRDSRGSSSHRHGRRDNDSHSNSSHSSGPKGRGSRSNGSQISIKRNGSSDGSGHSDVLHQYSSHSNGSHSNGSHGKGSKGLNARHVTGAEGEGGTAQLLESLSLSS